MTEKETGDGRDSIIDRLTDTQTKHLLRYHIDNDDCHNMPLVLLAWSIGYKTGWESALRAYRK